MRLGEPPILAKSHRSPRRRQPHGNEHPANSIERDCTRTRMLHLIRTFPCPVPWAALLVPPSAVAATVHPSHAGPYRSRATIRDAFAGEHGIEEVGIRCSWQAGTAAESVPRTPLDPPTTAAVARPGGGARPPRDVAPGFPRSSIGNCCSRHVGNPVKPDAYGRWSAHGQQIEFFLEYDFGTESARQTRP